MPHWILTSDWSEYENRKATYEERNFFSCEESWEIDYLADKIMTFNRDMAEKEIKEAISFCCKRIEVPRPRSVFIIAVLEKLRQREN